jgi:hypothetical protein
MPWWIFPKPETTMEKLNKDFREFIALLEKHAIEYLIVGGYAVAFHGFPRYTGDIDFFVAISENNATGLLAVFEEFGFGDIGIVKADFLEPDFVVEIGREPRKIQILTGIDGVTFEDCRINGITENYGDMSLRFIGIEELLKNKQASARDKDLIDLRALRDIHGGDGSREA